MQLDFYNTINESGKELKESRFKARTQQDEVLALFQVHKRLTPFEVVMLGGFDPMQITSVRRAITNLTSAGRLIKTDQIKAERLGKKNHVWAIV